MTNRKKILIVSALLVGAGAIYLFKRKNLKSANVSTTDTTTQSVADYDLVLAKGSTGEEVKILQQALKGGLVVDGIFGSLTEARLKNVTGKTSTSLNEYNNFFATKK